jgi:hypothetical protein
LTEKQKEIAETLFRNAKRIPFGSVAVELKLHAGKCVGIVYTESENTRQKEDGDDILGPKA